MAVSRNNTLLQLDMVGVESLQAALLSLPSHLTRKRVLERSLLEEGEPIARDARRLAPRDTGRMAEKIEVSTTLSRRQSRGAKPRVSKGGAVVYIGAGPRGPAVLAEFGTGPRYRWAHRGGFTGAMPATPFMRPAWERGWRTLLDRLGGRIWYELSLAAERARKKQARELAREAAKVRRGR